MAISDVNKLSIYNGALLFLGDRELATLADTVESRRLLDGVWDRDGIDTVLEQGQWNFAMRSAKYEYSPSITPSFGYSRAFEKPSDFVRVCAVCSDEFFTNPLLRYTDEAGYWFSDLDEIYVKIVSNDGSYGTDFSLWPPSFKKYVYSWFGSEIIWKLTQSTSKEEKKKAESRKLLTAARSKDAFNDPTKFLPPGRFRMARGSGYGRRHDGGHRSRLLG
ncbi:hypothetical protein KAR48_20255 [bacterium]|nr:hypothetical protein [bacterium]